MDAEKHEKRPAFDHEKLAAALGTKYTGVTLPFQEFTFVENGTEISFRRRSARPGAARWPATAVGRQATRRRRGGRGGGRGPAPDEPIIRPNR